MTTKIDVDDEVMDFTSPRKPLKFRVDDDVFEAAPDVAAELAIEFMDLTNQIDDTKSSSDEQIAVLHAMFNMVLLPGSAEKFIERLRSTENPISYQKISEIIQWLFGEYGLRPTESESLSLSGSANRDAGTNSTVSTSVAALTSGSSPSHAS